MKQMKINQTGFSAPIIILAVAIIGAVGFVAWKAVDNESLSRQDTTTQPQQLTPQDTTILTQARELQRIDFDLDGVSNSQDADDDNDGQNDDVDSDDDNDDVNDDADNDDDNDGVDDSSDDESSQQAELQESR